MEPNNRLCALVELATPRDLPPSLPIDKYLQVLMDIFQLGSSYAAEGDDEKAFVLFLRFVSIAVEELPNHDVYSRISISERLSIDAKIIEAITTAENLKANVKKRYELEYLESQKNGTSAPALPTFRKLIMPFPEWTVFEDQLGPYILCHEVSVQPIVFQRVMVPLDLPQTFLKHTPSDFRFAYLYGRLVRNSIVASHLIISSMEEINTKRYERFVNDAEMESDFPIIGCVCMSLSDVCKTSFFRRCQLSEMVCVICPQGQEMFNNNYILHLMNMSPSSSYHQKFNSKRELNGTTCRHLHIIDSVSSVVVNPNVISPTPSSSSSNPNSNS